VNGQRRAQQGLRYQAAPGRRAKEVRLAQAAAGPAGLHRPFFRKTSIKVPLTAGLPSNPSFRQRPQKPQTLPPSLPLPSGYLCF